MPESLSRRHLLLAAPAILSHRSSAANSRVRVGIIGSGGRAVFETAQYPFFDNVEIAALCDCQRARRDSAKQSLEAAYSKTRGSAPSLRTYSDFRELLAQKDIDAVYIATPDHWHVNVTLEALRVGKHCHTEKPLGVSIEQDLAALRAVQASKRVFQYGSERRSTPDARRAIELVLNGRIGQLRKIYVVSPPSETGGSATPVLPVPDGFDYEMWLGPAPFRPFSADRCLEASNGRNGIFFIYDYCLGFMANWAAHPLDLVEWWASRSGRLTPPTRYEGSGQLPSEGLFDTIYHWDVRCSWPDGLTLHFLDNETYRKYPDAPHPEMPWGRRGVTNVHNGAVFIGSEGWIIASYEKVAASNPAILDAPIGPNEIRLPDSSLASIPTGMNTGHQQVATAAHHQNWIKSILGESKPVTSIESAVRSDLVSQLSELCARTGKSLNWDPAKQTILGNDEARRRMSRPHRAPWKLA